MSKPSEQTAEKEKFIKSLPYPVKATNLAGAYAMAELPKDVDLSTAGPKTLLRHGIPFRRPTEKDRPALRTAWSQVFERRKPYQLIVPELEVQPRKTRRPRGKFQAADNVQSAQGNWGGAVVDEDATTGPWTSVTGQWVIPTVSIPSGGSPGVNNNWECTSWVGIDGFNELTAPSNDVLQVGIDQTVDPTGKTTCTAWFEWFVQNASLSGGVYSIAQGLTVLPDTTPMSPSLASVGTNLYLAWRGDGNDQMNVMVSADGGQTFRQPPLVTADTSQASPAICEMNGNLYIAWKGDGNDNLNIAQVALDPTGYPTGLVNKVSLSDTSKSAPALCGLNGMLYLAWRGEGNDHICIMRSPDGQTWTNQLVSGQNTPTSPALGVCNDQLFVAWRGDGNEQLNVATVALDPTKAPTALANVNTLGITSPQAPALAGLNGFLYLSFMGDNGDELYVFVSEDEGATFPLGHGSSQTSPSGPAMAAVNNQMMLSWRGEDNDLLNVVPILSNFDTYPYIAQTNIKNFPVNPGDSIVASVTYNGNSSGVVQIANNTTNLAFSLTLLPPTGANFNGKCVEWIIETPQYSTPTGLVYTALPSFTQLVFSTAFGCNVGDKVTANPANGVSPNPQITNSAGTPLTTTTTGADTLTVNFQ
jgi:hypothetical protein